MSRLIGISHLYLSAHWIFVLLYLWSLINGTEKHNVSEFDVKNPTLEMFRNISSISDEQKHSIDYHSVLHCPIFNALPLSTSAIHL